MRGNHKFTFPLELERGSKTVEYEVRCEVTPYDPGRTSGPPESCYPPEGNEVEVKEVYRVFRRACPGNTHEPAGAGYREGTPCRAGPTCRRCHGRGYVELKDRRPELDDLVEDAEVLEHLPESCGWPDEDDYDDDR